MQKQYVANEKGFSGERWPQHREEVDAFLDIILEAGATSYLEIGCLNGDTLHYIGSRLPVGSRIVGVDLPRQHPMYANAPQNLSRAVSDLQRLGQDAKIILGNSRDGEVIEGVWLSAPYDAILIDGDHSYSGVRADWENYGRMTDGVVGFHDAHKLQPVRDFYNELTYDHRSRLLIKNEEVGLGIGVIWV